MSEETGSSAGGEAIAADTSELTVTQAKEMLFSQLEKEPSAESADTATAEQELAKANVESPQQETINEDQENEPAKPAIDPPKSWTKDLHEHWASLDPILQERIVARDREDQAAIKRAFNEADADRKAVRAEREAAEKARQQYEAQLPTLMQTLTDAQQSSFADIRTVDDVTRLANEDPFRYLQWQAHQTKLQAVNAELERAKGQQSQKQQTEWTDHVQRENALAADFIPELADKVKGPALTQRVATELLPELGFKPEELNDLANGKQKLSIYDHRVQRLLADAVKLRDIQSAKAVATKAPVPPVLKPGAKQPSGSQDVKLQALEAQLIKSGSIKDAKALLDAQLRASQRRPS